MDPKAKAKARDLGPKAKGKAKDLGPKAKDLGPKAKAMDVSSKAKDLGHKAKNLGSKAKAKAMDLSPKAKNLGPKAKAKDFGLKDQGQGLTSLSVTGVRIIVSFQSCTSQGMQTYIERARQTDRQTDRQSTLQLHNGPLYNEDNPSGLDQTLGLVLICVNFSSNNECLVLSCRLSETSG